MVKSYYLNSALAANFTKITFKNVSFQRQTSFSLIIKAMSFPVPSRQILENRESPDGVELPGHFTASLFDWQMIPEKRSPVMEEYQVVRSVDLTKYSKNTETLKFNVLIYNYISLPDSGNDSLIVMQAIKKRKSITEPKFSILPQHCS